MTLLKNVWWLKVKSVINLKIADWAKYCSTGQFPFYYILLCGMLNIYKVYSQIWCIKDQKFENSLVWTEDYVLYVFKNFYKNVNKTS